MDGSLLGLGIGMILAVFHVCGMVLVFSARLYICVRYVSALGPRCLRCFMLMSSGPVELLFRAACMACLVCCVVMCMGVVSRCFVFLSVSLLFVCVLCVTVFVNCLLKWCAFCLCVVAVWVPKEMVVLGVCVGFLLFSPAMVFQSMCVFVLWSQSSSRCCFHSCVLCSCMSLSICVLRIGI